VWESPDPALEKYLPKPPKSTDEFKNEIYPEFHTGVQLTNTGTGSWKNHYDLPGMGGVFETKNLNTYSYATQSPIVYSDPDGNFIGFFIGAGVEITMQMALDGKSLSQVDYGDVLAAGVVSAIIPGAGNALKVGIDSAKVATKAGKAIEVLSKQSANTLNRAGKLEQRIGKNIDAIKSAASNLSKAGIIAGVHIAVKSEAKELTPPMQLPADKQKPPTDNHPNN